jgi:septum formation protein
MLILGSASPRRAALLAELNVAFAVRASEVPEVRRAGEAPAAFARRAAGAKAAVVARLHPGDWVLAADTIVVVDGVILGKPKGAGDAGEMLRRLSGRTHDVLTAVVLCAPGGRRVESAVVRSGVEFRRLREEEIAAYVASGEPADKAGAYAIQGGAAGFVRRLDGSVSNVIGLPVDEVRGMLERHGLLGARAAAEH